MHFVFVPNYILKCFINFNLDGEIFDFTVYVQTCIVSCLHNKVNAQLTTVTIFYNQTHPLASQTAQKIPKNMTL